jgi:thiamin-phosphate kinase
MDDILENVAIGAWVKAFSRAPGQANAPHESDAELIELPGDPEHLLAITIDTVAEEIHAGLYQEPYTMGWVTVMASLSDLAAVGADPLGMVVSVSAPLGKDSDLAESAGRGMEDACRSLGVFILGGDSNLTSEISLTGCSIGIVPKNAVLTRRGVQPGDAVFVTGRAGAGNALGLVRLSGLPDECFPESNYRPSARLAAGRALRGRATAAMDTSDGVLTTLDQLMRLNGHGFEIDCDWSMILSEDVLALCLAAEALSEASGWPGVVPIRLGTVQERAVITLALPSRRRVDIDMSSLRNLLDTSGGDLAFYLSEFKRIGGSWGLE